MSDSTLVRSVAVRGTTYFYGSL